MESYGHQCAGEKALNKSCGEDKHPVACSHVSRGSCHHWFQRASRAEKGEPEDSQLDFPQRGESTGEPGSCTAYMEIRNPDAHMAKPGSSREEILGYKEDLAGGRDK